MLIFFLEYTIKFLVHKSKWFFLNVGLKQVYTRVLVKDFGTQDSKISNSVLVKIT